MAKRIKAQPGHTYEVLEGQAIYGESDISTTGVVTGRNDLFNGESDSFYGYSAYGDGEDMGGTSVGGRDTFHAGSYVGYSGGFDPYDLYDNGAWFAGDAQVLYGNATGGADSMDAGDNSVVRFAGDAEWGMADFAHGGADQLEGSSADAYYGEEYADNVLMGDATWMQDAATGGNDRLYGGDAWAYDGYAITTNWLAGEGEDVSNASHAGNDAIHMGNVYSYADGYGAMMNFAMGDALYMDDVARAGNDTISGGNVEAPSGDGYAINFMAGDASEMDGAIVAGNDSMHGGDVTAASSGDGISYDGYAVTLNLMAGDAFSLYGSAAFGNDTLTGGTGISGTDGYAFNGIYGDLGDPTYLVESLPGAGAIDGFDALVGALESFGTSASGSALATVLTLPEDHFNVAMSYGNDRITGGAEQASNYLVGDTEELFSGDKGGNDRIAAGSGEDTYNLLVGDSFAIYLGGQGGNDTLIAGHGMDQMWGDAQYEMDGQGGADTFVIGLDSGEDVIWDFRAGDRDRIDLRTYSHYSGFGSLSKMIASGHLWEGDGGVYIDLDITGVSSGMLFIADTDISDFTVRSFTF